MRLSWGSGPLCPAGQGAPPSRIHVSCILPDAARRGAVDEAPQRDLASRLRQDGEFPVQERRECAATGAARLAIPCIFRVRRPRGRTCYDTVPPGQDGASHYPRMCSSVPQDPSAFHVLPFFQLTCNIRGIFSAGRPSSPSRGPSHRAARRYPPCVPPYGSHSYETRCCRNPEALTT